ncbi:CYTH domain-containing protein [Lutibacter sp. HS1-25]|uniref:CYTH domain-containing protein n=1 Tax=Lutibacter sp. HS1-25 TaxID=2485000 RepID=UPI00101243C1|nr:CYTH domain-containing protein [Lutibacter sp. HS1-25]RXP44579.1 CYTH domain-containing protein [Lutibacter sp. HS1-25]
MSQEIERKFLVKGDFKNLAVKSYQIAQGFLSTVPERTVRVRIKDLQGFITVKGIGNASGTTRFEWEKEISVAEAESLLAICEPTIIKKVRYIVPATNNLFFEVDVFLGANLGLEVAEIELPTEDAMFEKPDWLGAEVTGQSQYYNASLAKNPFSNW